jgi:hypothetical protein
LSRSPFSPRGGPIRHPSFVATDLNQVGDKLSGTLQTLDVIGQVTGKATGTHFELWGVGWNETKPFLVGDLVNGELHATLGDAADVLEWGDQIVAHKATAADEMSRPPYIEPPAMHTVQYNGLAKTPS